MISPTLLRDAAQALDALAQGGSPQRAQVLAGAVALDALQRDPLEPGSRDLMDAAQGLLRLAAEGLDLDETGRARPTGAGAGGARRDAPRVGWPPLGLERIHEVSALLIWHRRCHVVRRADCYVQGDLREADGGGKEIVSHFHGVLELLEQGANIQALAVQADACTKGQITPTAEQLERVGGRIVRRSRRSRRLFP